MRYGRFCAFLKVLWPCNPHFRDIIKLKFAENMQFNENSQLSLISLKNINIRPSYEPKMVRMPIFRHTLVSHNFGLIISKKCFNIFGTLNDAGRKFGDSGHNTSLRICR